MSASMPRPPEPRADQGADTGKSATPAGRSAIRPSAEWAQRPERSNTFALRLMAWIAVTFGRRIARLVLHPITIYFLLFSPSAARQSRRFLRRALGRQPRFADHYRHILCFAATLLDRIYLLRAGPGDFDISLDGHEMVAEAARTDPGCVLVGAHLGSFESLRVVGDHLGGLKVAMVMYPDNARMMNRTLEALAPTTRPHVIALGQMGSMLEVRDWLDAGGMAGILGDRSLHADPDATRALRVPFLGKEAEFIDGPMRLAALLRRRVFFMVGLYRGGARYDVRFFELADFRHTPPRDREVAIREALLSYVDRLEALAREAPYNWFNFHDFWNEDI